MNKLHIDDKVFELPTTMNEMSNEQLTELAKLVAVDIPVQEIKVKMLLFCMQAHLLKKKKDGEFRIRVHSKTIRLSVDEITMASSAFDWLFTRPDKDGNCFLDVRLTRCPYPEITINDNTFYAPDDYLTDLLYNQYIYLQSFAQAMVSQPEVMCQWLGAMFRADKSRFDENDLNTGYMKLVKPHVFLLMNWFWIGSCRFIADKFPRIFPDESETESGGDIYSGQQRLLDYIAKGDPEKKRAYKADRLYDILFSLDFLLEQEEANAPVSE